MQTPDPTPRRSDQHVLPLAARERGLSPTTTRQLVDAYLAGDSWATIALRFEVDPATVGRLLRLRGVKMRPRRGGIRGAE